jgi:hypothetical protein
MVIYIVIQKGTGSKDWGCQEGKQGIEVRKLNQNMYSKSTKGKAHHEALLGAVGLAGQLYVFSCSASGFLKCFQSIAPCLLAYRR